MEQLPLKDIHLPESVSIWPLAWGWWLLIIAVPGFLLLVGWFYRRFTRQTPAKYALALLRATQSDIQTDNLQKLTVLSEIFRRTAISLAPRRDVAGLNGDVWLCYLDSCLSVKTKSPNPADLHPFSQGIGQLLAYAHFQAKPPNDEELTALFKLCERWLKQQAKR